MKPLYFGSAKQPIFGVYHAPRGNSAGLARAVLICPPIGQEYIRSHWTIRLLASQLARKGVHVFRMDYLGMGDSALNMSDIQSLSQWQENIAAGVEKLREFSSAESVTLMGVRFGAVLAAHQAIANPDQVHSLLTWEPVESGADYLNELREMHKRMLDLWVCKMETDNNEKQEEILGTVFTRSFLEEVEACQLNYSDMELPHLLVELESRIARSSHGKQELLKSIQVDDEYSWADLAQLETAWLRPKSIREIVSSTVDLFDRLEQHDLLKNRPVAIPSLTAQPISSVPQGAR